MTAQNMQALALANEVRIPGGQWRREVKALGSRRGLIRLAETLERDTIPRHIGALRISHFLTSADRMGSARASRVAEDARIYRFTQRGYPLRIRDLTTRERKSLAKELRFRASGERR